MRRVRGETVGLAETWRASLDEYVVRRAAVGRDVVVGLGSGELVLLDGATGARRWSQSAHPGGVLALDARDGRIVSAGQDGRAALRDASGDVLAEVRSTDRRAPWIEHAVLGRGARSFALGVGATVQLHDDSGALSFAAPMASTVAALAFRPDDGALAACAYGGVRIWSLDTLEHRDLSWKGSLLSLAWRPDGRIIACASQDSSVHFWRLPTGADSQMSGYPGRIRVVSWDGRGELLATSGDETLTLWDFSGRGPEGTRPIQLAGHLTTVTCAAFHPRRGLLASGSSCGEVRLFHPRGGRAPIAAVELEEEVTTLGWSDDDLLVGTAEGTMVALRCA
jgi:WD40 repeat protein